VCLRACVVCFESEGRRRSTRLRVVERQEQEAALSAKFRQGSALDALRIDLEARRVLVRVVETLDLHPEL
jgi:hypothetical protein